jgi:fructokinase
MSELLGAVELGGTKVLAAVARDPTSPLKRIRVPTTDPNTTLGAIANFFDEAAAEYGPPAAIGIASFGPIRLRRGAEDWGRMLGTTKPGWPGADVAGIVAARLGCPVSLDTDVNGAALAEMRCGAGRGLASLVYLTVGTGIGGGLVLDGRTIQGVLHPEIGHVRLQRHPEDPFPSRCPYHDACAEGLASGPAIQDRFGASLDKLDPDHPFRAILADYLGQVCATLVLVCSPERIVIGGGVMTGGLLHAGIEAAMMKWLGGYVEPNPLLDGAFVVPPGLGDEAGLIGGFALAQDLL